MPYGAPGEEYELWANTHVMNSQDEPVASRTHSFVLMALPGLLCLENQNIYFKVYKSIDIKAQVSVTDMLHQSSEIPPSQ